MKNKSIYFLIFPASICAILLALLISSKISYNLLNDSYQQLSVRLNSRETELNIQKEKIAGLKEEINVLHDQNVESFLRYNIIRNKSLENFQELFKKMPENKKQFVLIDAAYAYYNNNNLKGAQEFLQKALKSIHYNAELSWANHLKLLIRNHKIFSYNNKELSGEEKNIKDVIKNVLAAEKRKDANAIVSYIDKEKFITFDEEGWATGLYNSKGTPDDKFGFKYAYREYSGRSRIYKSVYSWLHSNGNIFPPYKYRLWFSSRYSTEYDTAAGCDVVFFYNGSARIGVSSGRIFYLKKILRSWNIYAVATIYRDVFSAIEDENTGFRIKKM